MWKDKKIGILTFHRADNLGAVLQAYALQRKLNEISNANTEIIDYICDTVEKERYPKKNSSSIKGYVKYFLMQIYYGIKRQGFQKFRKNYLKTSKVVYNIETIKNANTEYDAFVCGSDQIWNLACSGEDFTYFLDFADRNKKKYSYAASLGVYQFSDEEYIKVDNFLGSFDAISVRESSAIKEINRINKRNINVLPDPVFLLDNMEWEKIVEKRIIKEKYILVYLIQQDVNVMKNAKKYAETYGYKIISNKKSIEFILNNSPEKFLSWIYYAEAVFTNSFHGTAFSVIFNKLLGADIELASGGVNNRVKELLEKVGGDDCILKKEYNMKLNSPNADKILRGDFKICAVDFLKNIKV